MMMVRSKTYHLPDKSAHGFVQMGSQHGTLFVSGQIPRSYKISQNLEILCKSHQHQIQQILTNRTIDSKTAADEIIKLIKIENTAKEHNPVFVSWMIQELKTVGWENVLDVSDEFEWVKLRIVDSRHRNHILEIRFLDFHDDSRKTQLCLELPNASESVRILAHLETLESAISDSKQSLEKYAELWDMLDDIDRHTFVLDPVENLRMECHRRIVLSRHVSLKIKLSPQDPKRFCDCEFFGEEQAVSMLRTKFHSSFHLWQQDRTVRENLEDILGVSFPTNTPANQKLVEECSICYSIQLVISSTSQTYTSFPDILCANQSCNKCFHAECLGEWLRALSTTRYSSHSMSGTCPCCEERIHLLSTNTY